MNLMSFSKRNLFFLALAAICLLPVSHLKALTLTMNHQFPEDAVGSLLDKWFAEEVERVSGGEVKIKIFWSNALGDANQNLLLLKTNSIDMAAMSPGYFPNDLPLFSAPNSIPMGMDNVCQASRIMQEFLKDIPAFQEEALKNGIRPLFFHLLNPYLLVSVEPVKQFADLKGKRIRTWGADMPQLVEAADAIPVSLFLPDIYNALNNRVIDALPFSTDLMVSYKIYELAKHVTEVVMWEGPSWGVWISEKRWQSLPEKLQNVLISISEEALRREIPQTITADIKAREFLKTMGVQFHKFPKEELKKWQDSNPDFFGQLVSKLEAKGYKAAGRQMIEIWKRNLSISKCP